MEPSARSTSNPSDAEIVAEIQRQLRAKAIEHGATILKGEFLGMPTEVPCYDQPPCLCLEEHRVRRHG